MQSSPSPTCAPTLSRVAPVLPIRIGAAVGRGGTELSAFDDALAQVGLGDVNLIRLSSVIPPDARLDIVVDGSVAPAGTGWGDRLYCVYAAQTAAQLHGEAWAGIGWIRSDLDDGRGLFVEHEAGSEAELERLITTSLDDMDRRRPQSFSAPMSHLVGARCERPGEAVCALVIATYAAESWTRLPAPETTLERAA